MTKRVVAGAAALLLLVACGGGGKPEPSSPAGSMPATFKALAERAQEATYRFDYNIVGPTGDLEETGTLYRKPPKMRIDRSVGSPSVLSTLIWRDDELIDCDRPEGGEWRCAVSPSEGLADGLPLVITHPERFNITERERRTLAGEETDCFLAVPAGEVTPPFPEEFEVCLSAGGAPLFQRTRSRVSDDAEGNAGPHIEVTREATSYTTQVDDSDFDPPAEPIMWRLPNGTSTERFFLCLVARGYA